LFQDREHSHLHREGGPFSPPSLSFGNVFKGHAGRSRIAATAGLLILAVSLPLSTGQSAGSEAATASMRGVEVNQTSSQTVEVRYDLTRVVDAPEAAETVANLQTLTPSTGISQYNALPSGEALGDDLIWWYPVVSRFVSIPPEGRFEVVASPPEVQRLRLEDVPSLAASLVGLKNSEKPYPVQTYEVSRPLVVRGIRMVKVTFHPLQVVTNTGELILNRSQRLELRFGDPGGENEVALPFQIRSHRSREFERALRLITDSPPVRDLHEGVPEPAGHYLVVTHPQALQYVAPFVEWRRRSGWRVDILTIPENHVRNPREIKALIQARYSAFLDRREDPFDQILLVGDREYYTWPPVAGWILDAEAGESVWSRPTHADYKYACLEGDDNYPDAGIARWCAGSPTILELFTLRTLAYEMTPAMDDPDWFTRGAVFSQHWGNTENTAFHPSIPGVVRWAGEALRAQGFRDVRSYEDNDWDQDGRRVGAFEQRQFNDGVNLMLGRAESLIWAQSLNGIEANTIFPVRISLSGHGEYATWSLLRNSTPDAPKGPVVATCNWGGPPTVPTNAVFLETVDALLNHGLTYGWARVVAVTTSENYFPDLNLGNATAYGHIKTDNDYYGDPGLVIWNGVPRRVTVDFPEVISASSTYLAVTIRDALTGEPTMGARVTLYAPGAMPAIDNADYATYNGYRQWHAVSDDDGNARFGFASGSLVNGTSLYLTITGSQIRPLLRQAAIRNDVPAIRIVRSFWDQIEGSVNGEINPGEAYRLSLRIGNQTGDALQSIVASIRSGSSGIVVPENSRIEFGNVNDGAEANGQNAIEVRIEPWARDASQPRGRDSRLEIIIAAGDREWSASLPIDVRAPELEVAPEEVVVEIGDEVTDLAPLLRNRGRAASPALEATLLMADNELVVLRWVAGCEAIEPAEARRVQGSFQVRGRRVVPGTISTNSIALEGPDGPIDTLMFAVVVGRPDSGHPLGPDPYGYSAFDNTDVTWPQVPEYRWIEINPADQNFNYRGTRLPFEGNALIGEATVVPLPFPIGFYGQFFDTITICSNGYLMPGVQPRAVNFQNWPLDRGFGGGSGMIAPLWDRLVLGGNGAVFYYLDEAGGRVIIQWNRLRHAEGGETDLTFEAILYSRHRNALETGDTEILFNYKTISNAAGDANLRRDVPFASVGIASPTGDAGLDYSFRNAYPVAAAPLAARRAIKFTPSIREHDGVVMGRVRRRDGGAPVAGAVVGTDYGLETITDQSGNFLIGNVVDDHPFRMVAASPGYADFRSDSLRLPASDTLALVIELVVGQGVDDDCDALPPPNFDVVGLHPNPFNDALGFTIRLPFDGRVRYHLTTLDGRAVGESRGAFVAAGERRMTLSSRELAAGIYLLVVEVEDARVVRKAVLIK